MHASGKYREAGYTLIEVTIVIIIMGILIGLSVPHFSGNLGSYRLQSAAKQLASDIREIQQMMITEQPVSYQYKLFFDLSRNKYYLMKNTIALREVNLERPIALGGHNFPDAKIVFNQTGRVSVGGSVRLINETNNDQLWVIVDPPTGRVRISKTAP